MSRDNHMIFGVQNKMVAVLRSEILALLSLIAGAHCWVPRIINGRPKGGKLGAPKLATDVKLPPEQWFTSQRLDHFDGANVKTWSQRYFVNDTFYTPGGPIFVMIGGEGPANPIWMVEGAWIMYAEKFNAICVQVEHRYYGKSHPVEDLSLPNMRYLNSRQALADLAHFIDFFRADRKLADNKLISFGGSYPGSLSAWFRVKYPYMVDGSVATSAPIFAKVQFEEYMMVTTASLATSKYGNQCNVEILNATQMMTQWWDDEDKRAQLFKMFKLCDKIDPTNMLDKAGFFANLAGNFEGVVQYNKDNRAFEGAVGTDITIDTLCSIMNDFTRGSALQRYADVNTLLLDTYEQDCLDYTYTKMVDDMRKTDWNSSAGEGGRQWMYQTCAEFGWFQSSECMKQPFGHMFPVNYSYAQCMDIFEKEFTGDVIQKNVADTNCYYGGRDIRATKIVFPNGSIDPWHAMGVTSDISPEATAIYINGTAHCANMYPVAEGDNQELIAARVQITKLIYQWLD